MKTFAYRIGLVLFSVTLSQSFGAIVHDYEFHGSLADSLGGPSLIANGGTVNVSSYSFGPNQGLTVSNALPNPAEYAILVDFSFDNLNSYRRIIDFKNLASDTGLYNLNTALNFYNIITGNSVFALNTPVRLVLTRNDISDVVTGYVNGLPQITFSDTGNLAVFDQPNAIMHFFIDDFFVGGEAAGGVVSKIVLYDTALTSGQVSALGPVGTPVPEPGVGLICASALATMALRRTRSKK